MAYLIASTRMQEDIGRAKCGSRVIYFMIAHWDSNAATVCMIRCSIQQGCASCASTIVQFGSTPRVSELPGREGF